MDTYLEKINALIPIHQGVAGLNPALDRLYPIALAVDDQLRVYDHLADSAGYQFIQSIPAPMPIPVGVRAAFQLGDYGGRIACVVTPEVFEKPAGYVTILHEFVHCYQYETCEQALKLKLDVARQASEGGDVMWEIAYPFPYQAVAFTRAYAGFLRAVSDCDAPEILRMRGDLRAYLGLHDYEYLVWQEWKEGFARWVENRVQRKLGLAENKLGLQPPYSRVSFYAGGAALIDCLFTQDPSLVGDLRGLFHQISLPMKIN